ncbi:YraN family protein [Adlercreutzia sp. ZJ138]|uniref:YraN family protein n=1 Tax=Adlercreutzia sp. ZJ138 TaxID=2709405 RepID=UPI0013EA1CF9|nr:YraN family protein [Adlercreutzia sp. ZJ138]
MKELKAKALKAAERFIEHRGYTLIESTDTLPVNSLTDIIANSGNALVFIEVLAKDDADSGFPKERYDEHIREAKEMDAIRWLQRQDGRYCDMQIRFDVISVLVIAPNRAFIRHHVNVMGESELAPDVPIEPTHPHNKEPMPAHATA